MELLSDSAMHQFFEAWFRASEAIRKKPTSNLQKDAEELVETMWNPANYHTLSWGLADDSTTRMQLPPYTPVWPVIPIYSDSAKVPADSLENMFPSTLYGSKILLYNKLFFGSIDNFLKLRNPKHLENQKYISNFVALSCHTGGCDVLGEPEIYSVTIRDNGKTAIVSFELAEQGINETFSKVNGEWKAIKREMTWIE